jgi:hypothetical protein
MASLAGWIARDLADSAHHDLRDFDSHDVPLRETAMWRSYYDHHSLRLLAEMNGLLRRQFHLPFWQSCAAA